MRLFSIRYLRFVGSIPTDVKQPGSNGSMWREITTISTPPTDNTTVVPMRIVSPRDIATVAGKLPSEISSTRPVTVKRSALRAEPPASACLPPSETVTSAPTPASHHLLVPPRGRRSRTRPHRRAPGAGSLRALRSYPSCRRRRCCRSDRAGSPAPSHQAPGRSPSPLRRNPRAARHIHECERVRSTLVEQLDPAIASLPVDDRRR